MNENNKYYCKKCDRYYKKTYGKFCPCCGIQIKGEKILPDQDKYFKNYEEYYNTMTKRNCRNKLVLDQNHYVIYDLKFNNYVLYRTTYYGRKKLCFGDRDFCIKTFFDKYKYKNYVTQIDNIKNY